MDLSIYRNLLIESFNPGFVELYGFFLPQTRIYIENNYIAFKRKLNSDHFLTIPEGVFFTDSLKYPYIESFLQNEAQLKFSLFLNKIFPIFADIELPTSFLKRLFRVNNMNITGDCQDTTHIVTFTNNNFESLELLWDTTISDPNFDLGYDKAYCEIIKRSGMVGDTLLIDFN